MLYQGYEIVAVKVNIGGQLRDIDISACDTIEDVDAIVEDMRKAFELTTTPVDGS